MLVRKPYPLTVVTPPLKDKAGDILYEVGISQAHFKCYFVGSFLSFLSFHFNVAMPQQRQGRGRLLASEHGCQQCTILKF